MNRPFTIGFFGLPLAALLLHEDGHELAFAALPALEGTIGGRRLRRALGAKHVLDSRELGDGLNPAIESALAQAAPDLLVSWFWPRLIPGVWLGRARLGAIGAHPSLLPRHRGPNPYFWTIDEGDAETGVSVHRLTATYDEGAVLATATIATGERNAWQLARALDRPSLRLLRQVVSQFARGVLPAEFPQDSALITWAPEPSEVHLRVDWNWPSERILRRIRAISPVPGLAIEIRGLRLFVTAAAVAADYPQPLFPGEAATLGRPPAAVVLRTGDGAVRIQRATLAREAEPELAEELDGPQVAALIAAAPVIDCPLPEGNG
jgi:methionyl-tRNA formyltransferase